MSMKHIPWWQPQIGSYEQKLIKKVLESHFPNEGKYTSEFEIEIGKLLNVKHVLAVTNATSAMFLSLKAFGIGHGDEVIVPDLTFIATANAVSMSGATVKLVDVNPQTLMLDVEQLKKTITKKTKAIIPVHVSGRAAEIVEIIKIAKQHNIVVVEDAAEAFMSKYKGKYLGTFGSTGCFSLTPAKTITTGQGGFVVTNDTRLYKILKVLKNQGRSVIGTGGDDIHDMVGYNLKFTDIQAAMGLGQLHYLKHRIERMKRNYEIYKRELSGIKEVSILPCNTKEEEIPQWTEAILENRDKLVEYFDANNIGYRKFWYPIHTQKAYKMQDKLFPNSTKLSPKLLWLPSAFTLSDADIKQVCEHIKKFYNK